MNCQRAEQAAAFRDERGYPGGYVIFCGAEISGWCRDLKGRCTWVPGCIAVDESGSEWEAVGGDNYNGAERWSELEGKTVSDDKQASEACLPSEYYFVSFRARPFVPVSPEFDDRPEAERWLLKHGNDSMRLISAGFL